MVLIKTYRRDEDGTLLYREAWSDRTLFIVHEGKVGTKGKTRSLSTKGKPLYRQHLPTMGQRAKDFGAEAEADGFTEVADEEHGWVVLQVWTHSPDHSHPKTTVCSNRAGCAERVPRLAWGRTLRRKRSRRFSPGRIQARRTMMNLFCNVVDIALGVKALRGFAREFGLTQHYVIASREPGEASDYALAWSPRKRDKSFSLFSY